MTRPNAAFEHMVKWLGAIAEASAKGQVTDECGLPGGRYLVCEEWPSRAAFVDYARQRHALEGVVHEDRLARAEDAQRRRRR